MNNGNGPRLNGQPEAGNQPPPISLHIEHLHLPAPHRQAAVDLGGQVSTYLHRLLAERGLEAARHNLTGTALHVDRIAHSEPKPSEPKPGEGGDGWTAPAIALSIYDAVANRLGGHQ